MATTKVPLVASRLAAACAIAALVSCGKAQLPAADAHGVARPTAAERLADIARAQVWKRTDIRAMDLRAGPQGKGALAPFANVTCDYVDRKMGGTPKFTCALAPDDDVKIKYGAANPEVYGVVAGSRLLWALGFGSDRWYPVTVVCHHCPADPHRNRHPTDRDVTFDIAALERQLPGKTIETRDEQGWSWSELDLVSEASGGAPVDQRDALKLLAVLLQHTDNKAQQQKLICLEGGHAEACDTPFMYLHDVGLTFGKTSTFNSSVGSGVNFENWSKESIWHDQKACVGNLPKSYTGTLSDPTIHEAGRRFLADLLVQLSDAQLHDLFEVSRFPQISHVSADQWAAAFKAKRDEIVNTACPQ